MTEREIIELWKQAVAESEDVYLATVVFVEGSSYREPGARMLMTSCRKRAGTIPSFGGTALDYLSPCLG